MNKPTMRRRALSACLLVAGLLLSGAGAAQTYSRTETLTYHDNTTKWVLDQTASVTCTVSVPASAACDGDVVSATTFDPTFALPLTQSAFGKLQSIMTYDTTASATSGQRGTLKTVKDGNNHLTTLSNWKRGIPQAVAFADGTSRSAVVNDHGWIASVTDENGYATSYGYDAMGRVNLITYPTGDSPGWNATHRSFVQVGATEYGVPAGHWRATVTTGNGVRTTVYDALWRPLLVREYDAGNVAATDRYTVTGYDAAGRPAYSGYPVATAPTSSAGSWTLPGVRTTYDALGRPVTVAQDSELGLLTTSTSYLAGFKTQVTNPRGQVTTTSYLAWDQPTTDYPTAIVLPEGAYTDIARDPFGKPTAITRRNSASTIAVTRSYAYDGYQQLCRAQEPETGATLMGYDAAGNLAWSASGLPIGTNCDPEGDTAAILARKAVRSYDARNRITALTFADHWSDTTYSYTARGDLASIATSNGGSNLVTTAYAYNNRGLLIQEQLNWNTITWVTRYIYDANGYLSILEQPGNFDVAYAPNALGQPRQAGSYATGVSYYPNGAMKQFTYGNGIVHTMTQNARGLPERSTDAYGATKILDDQYDYDPVGNVLAITDGATGRNQRGNRDMAYDGLNRLTDVASPMYGTRGAHYSYDVLDNLAAVTAPSTGADVTHWFCYDSRNHLTNVKTGGCTTGATVSGLAYDVQGNRHQRDNIHYTSDQANRLRAVDTPATTYVYDGQGHRVRDYNGGSRYSLYSRAGQLLYANHVRRGKQSWYVSLNGSLIATRDKDNATSAFSTTYQHTDALGSPVAITASNRTVLERREYEPYGYQLGGMDDDAGYTGHVQDAATGLIYMQQRYYDPGIGRDLSVDPVTAYDRGDMRFFNRYAYAFNNPYKFDDPDGRNPLALTGAGAGTFVCGPPCTVIGGAIGFGIGLWLGDIIFDHIQSSESSETPPAPGTLVGEQDKGSRTQGGRHNSGPLSGENGGTGNAETDFGNMTGGNSAPAGDRYPPGSQVGENGIIYRPGTETSGPRIDIPASGDKPHETLHYPKPPAPPRDETQ